MLQSKLTKFQYLFLYFIIYSFIGWCLETIFAIGVTGHFVNRGFLLGPICPIYGYGACMLITFLNKYKKNNYKLFFISALTFTIFEYISSFILDALFATKWWDYTNDFLNLNGRISIFYTLAWGVIAIIFLNMIHPFIKKLTSKILKQFPYILQSILLSLIFLTIVLDTFYSSTLYLFANS